MIDTFFQAVTSESTSGNSGEAQSKMYTSLHHVPKQIANSCNAVGVNEKTKDDTNMQTGVLSPTQRAGDRVLSIVDSIFDSLLVFVISMGVNFVGLNIYTYILMAIFLLYILAHSSWWEQGLEWGHIVTVKEYLKRTRNLYWVFLVISMLGVNTLGYYWVHKYDTLIKIEETIEELKTFKEEYFTDDESGESLGIRGAAGSFAKDFMKEELNKVAEEVVPKNNFSADFMKEELAKQLPENEITSNLMNRLDERVKSGEDRVKEVGSVQEGIQENISISSAPTHTRKKTPIKDYFPGFMFIIISGLFMLLSQKYFKARAMRQREARIKDTQSELNHNFNTMQDAIDDLMQ